MEESTLGVIFSIPLNRIVDSMISVVRLYREFARMDGEFRLHGNGLSC